MPNSSGTPFKVFGDHFSSNFELPKVSSTNNQEFGKEVSPNIKSVGKKASVSTMKTTTTPTKAKLPSVMSNAHQKKSSINFEINVPIENSNNKNDNSLRDENSNYQIEYKDNSKLKSSKKRNIALNLNLAFDVDESDENRSTNQSTNIMENSNAAPKIDQPSSIKVAVRMRPLSDSEKKNQKDGKITEFLIKDNRVLVNYKKESFEFDHCLDSSNSELFNFASQESVFQKIGKPQLDYAFLGYNVCLFAYGQSGSGKTYTMMGTEENPGIIPRFINELFRRINQIRDREFIVNISFLEIYNEKIYDLLTDEFEWSSKKLRIREHPQTGTYVEDLTVCTVESSENAMELLKNGLNRRKIASTHSNDTSNRSHTIFNIILVQNKILTNDDEARDVDQLSCISKINLVDLAGSERIGTANTDRFRESTMINKSLLTLGKVITQLADNNCGHIPYRESMLTYLLKDSLGGNSRTSMIATISPAKIHLEETLSTLRYASKARQIINIVRINEDPKAKIIDGLLRQISFLKKEVIKSKNEAENSDESERLSADDRIVEKQDSGFQKNGINYDEVGRKIRQDLKQKLLPIIERQKKTLNEVKNLRNMSSKIVIQDFAEEIDKFDHKLIDLLKTLVKEVENVDLLISKAEIENIPKQNIEIKRSKQKMEDKITVEKKEQWQQQKKEVKSIQQTECKYFKNKKDDIVENGDGQNEKKNKILNDFLTEASKNGEKKSDNNADEKLSINPKEQKMDAKPNLNESNNDSLLFENADDQSLDSNQDSEDDGKRNRKKKGKQNQQAQKGKNNKSKKNKRN